MAIEALEQEPCEDAISRQAVLDCLTASGLKKFDFILDARDKIKKLPPVAPKPNTDVLDKIRDEIIELRSRQNVGVLECLDIIDKYKKKKVQNQLCADTPPSIYIIGSLSQANQIKKVADSIKDADVRYVQSESDKTFNECVSTCFDNIEWADSIYAVFKPDGTIGQGVTYELEYAKRLNKEIQYIREDKE